VVKADETNELVKVQKVAALASACASAPTQNVQKSHALEDVADPGRGVLDPQRAVRGHGHVVSADQFAYTRRVDSGRLRQIQDDDSLAAIQKCTDDTP
jgi:hypothetical protein